MNTKQHEARGPVAALPPQGGFTLIELMIAVGVVAILASIALPAYSAYIQRSRVPPALDALSSFHVRMEQRFQDVNSYGTGACAPEVPVPVVTHFAITCVLVGTGFVATATGNGPMNDYRYTINQAGTRATTRHPKGVPAASCWSLRGRLCDA